MWENAIQSSNEKCLISVTRGSYLATELTTFHLENKTQAVLVINGLMYHRTPCRIVFYLIRFGQIIVQLRGLRLRVRHVFASKSNASLRCRAAYRRHFIQYGAYYIYALRVCSGTYVQRRI